MTKLTTIVLDTIDHGVVYRGERHIFLGKTGEVERWIDTHRPNASFESRGRQLTIAAETEYLAGKNLLKFTKSA